MALNNNKEGALIKTFNWISTPLLIFAFIIHHGPPSYYLELTEPLTSSTANFWYPWTPGSLLSLFVHHISGDQPGKDTLMTIQSGSSIQMGSMSPLHPEDCYINSALGTLFCWKKNNQWILSFWSNSALWSIYLDFLLHKWTDTVGKTIFDCICGCLPLCAVLFMKFDIN